jgi:hypothetical protein
MPEAAGSPSDHEQSWRIRTHDGSSGSNFTACRRGFTEYIRLSMDIASAAIKFGVEESLVNRDITDLVIRMESPLLH